MKQRFQKNVPGDFYTNGECLACGLPEYEAPQLFAKLSGDNIDTYFIRQPESKEELTEAIAAANVCCVNAVRYGGTDKTIIRKLDPYVSDHEIDLLGRVIPSKKA